jgi:hypothetical protein
MKVERKGVIRKGVAEVKGNYVGLSIIAEGKTAYFTGIDDGELILYIGYFSVPAAHLAQYLFFSYDYMYFLF